MAIEMASSGFKDRLEDIITVARSGHPVELQISIYRNLVKQLTQSESTDDIPVETDMCLFMADFKPSRAEPGEPAIVRKVYAMCSINESEIDDKTIRHLTNQRLKMDYQRLKAADIRFEEKYF